MLNIVTVHCPLCDDDVEVPDYDSMTRTDALAGHIISAHASKIRPATPKEGPPLPHGFKIKWPWKE